MIKNQEKQGMGRIEKNQYKNALTFGKEVRRHVRIVVIGEHGAGKSTLVRRLLKQDIDGIDSTDGIEMNNKFQINQKDGKWFFYKESEMENITKRIRQTVDRNPEIALPTKTDSIEEPNNSFIKSERNQNPHRNLEKKDSIAEHVNPSERNSNGQEPITWKHPYKKSEQKEPSSPLNIKEEINTEKIVTEDPIVTDQTYVKKKYTDTIKIYKNKSAEMPQLHDPPREDLTSNITYNVMESDKEIDAIFLKAKNISTKLISEDLIQGDIWDFAGEKDYYVTHQTFLTPNAIYLIVADINKDIKTVDMIEKERYFDSIAGYIDFWFDSIHCFCEYDSTDECIKLNPPILMVLTHTDKCDQVDARIKKYDEDFTKVIGSQTKGYHNRGIHFVSNTNNFQDDILKLKEQIVDIARETDFFAEELPTEWIRIEHALAVLRNENETTVSWERMKKIASRTSLTKTKQLIDFLTHQTKIGNIIFFNDVRDYIILKPEWLVKCFRCLVFNDSPKKTTKNFLQTPEWFMLASTGHLSTRIINTLFEKECILESQKQDFLLKVMEKFDVIIKPKVKDRTSGTIHESNLYFIPCMIKTEPISFQLIEETFAVPKDSRFSKSPWLIVEFVFLPLAYFNHILFYYIRNYTVCSSSPPDESKAIYKGKAVFYIDADKEFSKLIVCFSKNALSLQIWKWEDVRDDTYRTILEDLCNIIKQLNRKLRQNLSFVLKAKCPDGDYSNSSDTISCKDLENLGEAKLYLCNEHTERHKTDEIENTWFKHVKSALEEYERNDVDKNYNDDQDEDDLDHVEEYEKDDGDRKDNNDQNKDETFRVIAETIQHILSNKKTFNTEYVLQDGNSICFQRDEIKKFINSILDIFENVTVKEINIVYGFSIIKTVSDTPNIFSEENIGCMQIPAVFLQHICSIGVNEIVSDASLPEDLKRNIEEVKTNIKIIERYINNTENQKDHSRTVELLSIFVENVQSRISTLMKGKDIHREHEVKRVKHNFKILINLYMNVQFLRSAFCIRYYSRHEPFIRDRSSLMYIKLNDIEKTQKTFLVAFEKPTYDTVVFFALLNPSEYNFFNDYMEVKGIHLQDLSQQLSNNGFAIRPQKWPDEWLIMSKNMWGTIWGSSRPDDKPSMVFRFDLVNKVDNIFHMRSSKWPQWYVHMKETSFLRGSTVDKSKKGEWKIMRLPDGKYIMCTQRWPCKFTYMKDAQWREVLAAYGDPKDSGYWDLISENELDHLELFSKT